jgi:hypothetical protein
MVAAALVAGACISSPDWKAANTTWDREETTYEQFETDRSVCEGQEDQTVEKCLREKGYYLWAERNQYDRARETLPGPTR